MEFAAVLNELQQKYGLKENEIAILRFLIDSNRKSDAREISRRTKIPMGRIYDFLNELLTKRLIEKTDGVPARYFVGDFGQQIHEFLNYQLKNMNMNYLALTSALENESTLSSASIRILHSKDEFMLELIRQAEFSGRFKVLLLGLSVPFVLYPESKEDFVKMRNMAVVKTGALTGKTSRLHIILNEAFNKRHNRKQKTEFAMSEKTFDLFIKSLFENYGKNFVKRYLLGIKSKLANYDAHIRILKESFPYYISISEKSVIFATRSGDDTTSVVFESTDAVKLMTKLFDLFYNEGRDINEVFDEYLKKI